MQTGFSREYIEKLVAEAARQAAGRSSNGIEYEYNTQVHAPALHFRHDPASQSKAATHHVREFWGGCAASLKQRAIGQSACGRQ